MSPISFLKTGLLLLCFCAQHALAQTPSEPKYPKEIGLDFGPLLEGKTGLGLTLKQNIGAPKGQKWVRQNVLRGLIGFHHQDLEPYVYQYNMFEYYEIDSIRTQQNWAHLTIGVERQHKRKRFQWHYGIDLGYWQAASKTERYQKFYSIGDPSDYFLYKESITIWQLQIAAFAGLSYALGSRFSIGSEFKIPYRFQYASKGDWYPGYGDFVVKRFNSQFGNDWFRMLYVAFRFKD